MSVKKITLTDNEFLTLMIALKESEAVIKGMCNGNCLVSILNAIELMEKKRGAE